MKSVILAGGVGSRIAEESQTRPKPMVEIGGRPILWHVLKIYSQHGIRDFIICTGFKGYVIKEYFANYFLHMSDVTFDMKKNSMEVHQRNAEPWKVTIVDTGEGTMTGGRLKKVASYIGNETFCMTYGDGVGDVDISALVAAHKKAGKKATVTAVQPPGRFGALQVEGESVTGFIEKPEGGWGMDKRRLFCSGTFRSANDQGGWDYLGAGTLKGPLCKWRTARLSSYGLLATHGYDERSAAP